MTHPLVKYGFSSTIVEPVGYCSNGVLIVGEAPGEKEDETLIPFCPGAPAGSVLERAIRRKGFNREQFAIANVVPSRPPNNYLDGAHYEEEAITWGLEHLDAAVAKYRPKAILALGGVATRATTGLAGHKLGVSNLTGFVLPSPRYGVPVVVNHHPSFLRRGAMGLFGVLMRSIKLAVTVAAEKRQPILPPVDNPPLGYLLHPTEQQVVELVKEVQRHSTDNIEHRYLAYDIETPNSTDEDVAEEAKGGQPIKSIQFSLAGGSGIYFPWREPFIEAARHILASRLPKLGWNNWRFDDPVLEANGCTIGGESHDLMWAWHHAQPDIPRGLQFAAAQSGWPWPWKHMDAANPAFYGIVDVDVLHHIAGV